MIAFRDDWLATDERNAVQSLRQLALLADQDPLNASYQPGHEHHDFFSDTLSLPIRCRLMEVYAYGDMGITLSLPGFSLTGMMLHLMQNDFAKHCLEQIRKERCRTFFAVTEKALGTELKQMQSHIEIRGRDWRLHADKSYVGKAATASCGMVIARIKDSQLLQPIFLSTPMLHAAIEAGRCTRGHLALHGLRAAQLGCIRMDGIVIPQDHLIAWDDRTQKDKACGGQLLHQTFNLMRPSVGAMAFGLARAIMDHLEDHYPKIYAHSTWQHQRVFFNQYHAIFDQRIKVLEKQTTDTALGSSCKMIGYHTLRTTITNLLSMIRAEWICDPWLEKWCRDHWGVEFMEGIPAIHYTNQLMQTIRTSHMRSDDAT